MILELVGLVVEEGVELGEVRSVFGLSIGLRAMVGMTVHVLKVLLGVFHVLAVIDLVVLTLAISDLPGIGGTDIGVLAEVRADEGSVGTAVVLADDHLGGTCSAQEAQETPAGCHRAEVLNLSHGGETDESTSEPAEVSNAVLGRPKTLEFGPVLAAHVVGEEVTHDTLAILM